MENNKLISMTEFVDKYLHTGCAVTQLQVLRNYKDFLQQPLTLSMFVPCDDEGNVLEEPELYSEYKPELGGTINKEWKLRCEAYNEAKSKVLFEGFKLSGDMIIMPDFDCEYLEIFIASIVEDMTVENLIGMNLTLTPTALKQIYG